MIWVGFSLSRVRYSVVVVVTVAFTVLRDDLAENSIYQKVNPDPLPPWRKLFFFLVMTTCCPCIAAIWAALGAMPGGGGGIVVAPPVLPKRAPASYMAP